MILLSGTTNSLQVVMGAGATTTQPTYFLSYSEINASTGVLIGSNAQGAANGTTPVNMLTGNASYQSKINQIDIFNADSVVQVITVQVLVGATPYQLFSASVPSQSY